MTQQETEQDMEARVAELEAKLLEADNRHREMRKTVVSVARRYAVQHGLCTVVDEALEAAGLGPQMTKVELKVTVPVDIAIDIDATAVEGMSEEERKVHVARYLHNALIVNLNVHQLAALVPQPVGQGGGRRTARPEITIGTFELEGFGVVEAPPLPGSQFNPPPGYMAKYSSNEGRVMHFFPVNADPSQYVHSMCSQIMYVFPSGLLDESPRGENRICGRCERSAAGLR